MISFLTGPIGKVLGAFALLAALYGGFRVWLLNHDNGVKAELVAVYEKAAAAATAAEQKRQADAVKAATDNFQKQLTDAKAAEAKASADLETRIKSYEQQLAAAHRDCLADDADVDFIVHNGAGAAGPVGHH